MTETNSSQHTLLSSRVAVFEYTLFMLLMAVLVTEVVLRVFDPMGMGYFSEAREYFSMMIPNNIFAYIHPPNLHQTFQGIAVSINRHGLRGPEFQTLKPENITRVMVLGDSLVFGWGVPQEAIFPAQLQDLLDPEKKQIEIIAAGVGSWNTRTEYEYLNAIGLQYTPDILILLITNNDVQPKHLGYTDVPRDLLMSYAEPQEKTPLQLLWQKAVSYSMLCRHIQYIKQMMGTTRQEFAAYTADSPQWQDASLALEKLINLCEKNRIRLLTYLYTSETTLHHDPIFRLYQTFLQTRGFQVYTLPDVLFQLQYSNSHIDRHPNDEGHRIIAEEMLNVLQPILSEFQ